MISPKGFRVLWKRAEIKIGSYCRGHRDICYDRLGQEQYVDMTGSHIAPVISISTAPSII